MTSKTQILNNIHLIWEYDSFQLGDLIRPTRFKKNDDLELLYEDSQETNYAYDQDGYTITSKNYFICSQYICCKMSISIISVQEPFTISYSLVVAMSGLFRYGMGKLIPHVIRATLLLVTFQESPGLNA